MNIQIKEQDFISLMGFIYEHREMFPRDQARIDGLIQRLMESMTIANTESRNTELGKCGCNCVDKKTQQEVLENGFTSRCDMDIGPCCCGAWHGDGPCKAKEVQPAVDTCSFMWEGKPNGILRVLYTMSGYKWQVHVRSQDSIEYIGEYDDQLTARKEWAKASILFGQQVRPSDAKVYFLNNGCIYPFDTHVSTESENIER